MPFDPTILLFILVGGFMLWWMQRNARRQQAAAMAFRNDLQPGQEVLTIGRMYGTVVEVDGNRVTLDLGDGVYGVWDKEGIMRIVPPETDDEVADDVADEDAEAYDDEYEDDYEDEYDDEAGDDEVLDDELLDDEVLDDDEVLADDGAPALDEPIEVPDDASSLTDPDEDPKKPR